MWPRSRYWSALLRELHPRRTFLLASELMLFRVQEAWLSFSNRFIKARVDYHGNIIESVDSNVGIARTRNI